MKTPTIVDWTFRSLVLSSLLFSQACLDDDPAGPRRDADTSEAAPVPLEELGESSLILDLAREIPGFAGVFYEPGGDRIVISMTGTNRAAFPVARQAVSARLAADVSSPFNAPPPVEFVERVVEYLFVELARHRARLRPRLFAIPEVVGLHVDEEFNRIGVGLENPSARAAVLDVAMELAVPVKMLSFSVESPIRELRMSSRTTYLPLASQNTLQTIITIPDTKLRGGYGVKALGGGYCTLGFTAIRAQRPAKNVGSTPVLVGGVTVGGDRGYGGEVVMTDHHRGGAYGEAGLAGRRSGVGSGLEDHPG